MLASTIGCQAGIQKIGDRDTRRNLISPENKLSISAQCEILGVSRTAHYYKPKGESEENLKIMKEIDKEHVEHPAKGVVGMTDYLLENDYKVGQRRERRLMRLMGIDAVYRRKSLSTLGKAVYIKPYLLRGLRIDHRNQVWSIDITYIPMNKGFMYLTAIIDVFSRFIVGWSLDNTLDASNCINVLKSAIQAHGIPEIINSDQGCQFSGKEWTETCAEYPEMNVSMDGRGRAKDNIWIERFWKMARTCSLESRDSLTTTTITVVTKESTIQYQASSTYGRLLVFN